MGKFRSGFGRIFLFLFVAAGLIASDFGRLPQPAAQAPVIKNIQTSRPEKKGLSNKDMEEICTAAISALLDQPTAAIHVEGIEKGLMYLSYSRPANGSPGRAKCKIEGKRVIWATRDGAWRTAASDEQVFFQLSPYEIRIIVSYPDGSERHFSFPQ